MNTQTLTISLGALLALSLLSGCTRRDKGPGASRQVIQNKGSDTLVNVAQAWAEAVGARAAATVMGGYGCRPALTRSPAGAQRGGTQLRSRCCSFQTSRSSGCDSCPNSGSGMFGGRTTP